MNKNTIKIALGAAALVAVYFTYKHFKKKDKDLANEPLLEQYRTQPVERDERDTSLGWQGRENWMGDWLDGHRRLNSGKQPFRASPQLDSAGNCLSGKTKIDIQCITPPCPAMCI